MLKLEISYRVTISSRILVSFRGCFFLGWLWKPSFLLLLIKTTIGKDGLDSIESMDDGLIIIIIIIIYLFIYLFIYIFIINNKKQLCSKIFTNKLCGNVLHWTDKGTSVSANQ